MKVATPDLDQVQCTLNASERSLSMRKQVKCL